jgi:hypothetical protein
MRNNYSNQGRDSSIAVENSFYFTVLAIKTSIIGMVGTVVLRGELSLSHSQ